MNSVLLVSFGCAVSEAYTLVMHSRISFVPRSLACVSRYEMTSDASELNATNQQS